MFSRRSGLYRFKFYFDLAANVVIVLTLGYMAYTVYEMRQSARRKGGSENSSVDGAVLASATSPAGRPALVIAINSKCEHCQSQMETYRRFFRSRTASSTIRSVKLVVPKSDLAKADWLSGLALDSSELAEIDFVAARIPGVPFLAIVAENGTVLNSWMGPLSAKQYQRIEADYF